MNESFPHPTFQEQSRYSNLGTVCTYARTITSPPKIGSELEVRFKLLEPSRGKYGRGQGL